MENNQQLPQQNDQPIWIKKSEKLYCRYEKLLYDTYKKNEIIVFFKRMPTDKEIDEVRASFKRDGIDPQTIKVKKCDNCNIPIMLFQATSIHTVINTEGVRSSPGTTTSTVGEEYSLNFFNDIPFDKRNKTDPFQKRPDDVSPKKEKIVVAVLDTGLDTGLVDPQYIWKGSQNQTDADCYKTVKTGYNFITGTADFTDDHPNKHGTIVSQYIINEFRKSPDNAVQIMPLKTHDKEGKGDLFGIICAIHFAIAKGANIINASWGFYYYFEKPMPYLEELITKTLREKGILFITAAGNKVDEQDAIAKQIFLSEHGIALTADQLRNLAIHNFYPAHLSDNENSVITVTTTDGKTVSPTQNYSNVFADLGVLADKVTKESMQFRLPFPGSSDLISGSSFATAIASGIIGAFCKKGLYAPGIKKSDFFSFLASIGGTGTIPKILFNEAVLQKKHIKKGAFTKKTS